MDELKNIAVMNDDTIYDALKRKYQSMFGKEPSSFEQAVEELKQRTKMPLADEILKVHATRKKVDAGHKVSMEEITSSIYTTKNFLTMFD